MRDSMESWSSTLLIADVILAAHRRISAVRTDTRLVRLHGKRSPLDAIDDVEEACPCVREHGSLIATVVDHRYERAFPAERDIGGFIDRPLPFAALGQPFLGAQRVQRHLQRAFGLWRIPVLVINDSQTPAAQ